MKPRVGPAREFRWLGWNAEHVQTIVRAAAVIGFAGAELYYITEHGGQLGHHALSPAGFTWHGA